MTSVKELVEGALADEEGEELLVEIAADNADLAYRVQAWMEARLTTIKDQAHALSIWQAMGRAPQGGEAS